MMLRASFALGEEAAVIERAVDAVLDDGWRTPDITATGHDSRSTSELGAEIARRVLSGA